MPSWRREAICEDYMRRQATTRLSAYTRGHAGNNVQLVVSGYVEVAQGLELGHRFREAVGRLEVVPAQVQNAERSEAPNLRWHRRDLHPGDAKELQCTESADNSRERCQLVR